MKSEIFQKGFKGLTVCYDCLVKGRTLRFLFRGRRKKKKEKKIVLLSSSR
jgi:hypothetical protein